MTFIRIILFSISMVTTVCMAGSADNTWYGEYHYSTVGGETARNLPITTDITLHISKQGNEVRCQLNAEGYQTYDRIVCTTAMDKNQLTLRFKSYADGSTVNPMGVEVYKVGETLFSLEKVAAKTGKKQNLFTPHWGKYSPIVDKHREAVGYFDKTK